MSLDEQIGNKVWYRNIYYILYIHELFVSLYKYKNQESCIYAKMNEPREHHAELNKPHKGGQTLLWKLVKLTEPSSYKAVTRSWVEGEMGHW